LARITIKIPDEQHFYLLDKVYELKRAKKRANVSLLIRKAIDEMMIKEGKGQEEKKYYTTKQAGEILGLSERAIQMKIQKGELKAIEKKDLGLSGKGYLIPEDEIQRYIDEQGEG